MFRFAAFGVAAAALTQQTASAQQREAILHRIEVPHAACEIVVATAKSDDKPERYDSQPDPNLIYLPNNLIVAYTPDLAAMIGVDALIRPAFRMDAAVIYVLPKRATQPATR